MREEAGEEFASVRPVDLANGPAELITHTRREVAAKEFQPRPDGVADQPVLSDFFAEQDGAFAHIFVEIIETFDGDRFSKGVETIQSAESLKAGEGETGITEHGDEKRDGRGIPTLDQHSGSGFAVPGVLVRERRDEFVSVGAGEEARF